MPKKPSRPCVEQGCPRLAINGASRCKEHYKEQTKKRFRMIKKNPDIAKLYNSRLWRNLRYNKLYQDPLCIECGKEANEVDHIMKHRGDRTLFYDWDNLQSMCKACHARKTLRGG
jgi:5-methylcytosine-specific restriction protein A